MNLRWAQSLVAATVLASAPAPDAAPLFIPLGDLGGSAGISGSSAFGVSADGTVVVGEANGASGTEAFRWTQAGGMVGLGDLGGGAIFGSSAFGVSADGAVVVGEANGSSGVEAFRWTQAGGMVGLGDLGGGAIFGSSAFGVSADGTVVVGEANGANGLEAVVWDEVNGIRSLQDMLAALGLDLPGWRLNSAQAVSDDGLAIAGHGTNPSGFREAWIVIVPEPSTSLLLAIGVSGLAALRVLKKVSRL